MRFSKLEEELTVNLLYSAFIRKNQNQKVRSKSFGSSLTFNDQFDKVFIYLAKNQNQYCIF